MSYYCFTFFWNAFLGLQTLLQNHLDGLSSETLEWLELNNTLTPDEKKSINSIPSDFYYSRKK